METTQNEILQPDSQEMDGKYLTFFCASQSFGVPIADVVQIVGLQQVTEVPEYPAYAKGIINLRGSIIPVIDVRLRLGKEEQAYDERTCIIVTQMHEAMFGFIVDAVDSVTDIAPDLISPPPVVGDGGAGVYITGVARQDSRVVLLMNTARLLSDDMAASLLAHTG